MERCGRRRALRLSRSGASEQLVGFEYELADAIAAKLGVKAKLVQNQWDQLIPALGRGNFDIILSGLEISDEHQQQVAMSLPYYVYAQQIVTRKDTDGLARMEDSRAKRSACCRRLSASVAEQIQGVDMRIYPGNVEMFARPQGEAD